MLIAVLLAISGLAHGSVDADRLIKEGDIYFSGGDWTSASARYTDAIALKDSPMLYSKRAACHIRLRQPSHALKDFDRCLDMDASFLQGYLMRGRLLRSTCSFNAATRDFEKVLELQPDNADAKQELLFVDEARKMVEAVQHLEQAPETSLGTVLAVLQPLHNSDLVDECSIMVMLEARANFKAQDWERVTALTGKLVKADPSNIAALTLRGQAYYYSYDHDLAKRHFGEALKYDPDYKDARVGFNLVKAFDRAKKKADSALASGAWVEAVQAYSDALHVDNKHNRGNKDLWEGFGMAHHNSGNYENSKQAFENVLVIEPENENAKKMLVKCLLQQELWDEAVAKARHYVSENQQNHQLRQLLAEAEKKLKMSKRKDYYKILGISKDATDRDIKKAYRDLARQYHPDKVEGNEEEVKTAEDKFREVAEAVEILSDEDKRRRYDMGEDIESMQQDGGNPFGNFHRGGGGQQFHFRWG